LISVY